MLLSKKEVQSLVGLGLRLIILAFAALAVVAVGAVVVVV